MQDTSLAELIAITQENIQRSYDFSNDLTEAYRASPDEQIILSLKEMKLELPVMCNLAEISQPELPVADIMESHPTIIADTMLRGARVAPEQRLVLRHAFLRSVSDARGLTPQSEERSQVEKVADTQSAKAKSSAKKQSKTSAKTQKPTANKNEEKQKELLVSLPNGKDISQADILQMGRLELTFAASLK